MTLSGGLSIVEGRDDGRAGGKKKKKGKPPCKKSIRGRMKANSNKDGCTISIRAISSHGQ